MADDKGRRQLGSGLTKFNPSMREKFLSRVEKNDGHVLQSCRDLGITPQAYYAWRKKFPDFANEVDIIRELKLEQMEQEAYRRAVHGWNTPVYYQGVEVGETKNYSDKLLTLLLGTRLGYKTNVDQRHGGIDEAKPIPIEVFDPGKLTQDERDALRNIVSKACQSTDSDID